MQTKSRNRLLHHTFSQIAWQKLQTLSGIFPSFSRCWAIFFSDLFLSMFFKNNFTYTLLSVSFFYKIAFRLWCGSQTWCSRGCSTKAISVFLQGIKLVRGWPVPNVGYFVHLKQKQTKNSKLPDQLSTEIMVIAKTIMNQEFLSYYCTYRN